MNKEERDYEPGVACWFNWKGGACVNWLEMIGREAQLDVGLCEWREVIAWRICL